jgi:hypothetical protein
MVGGEYDEKSVDYSVQGQRDYAPRAAMRLCRAKLTDFAIGRDLRSRVADRKTTILLDFPATIYKGGWESLVPLLFSNQ